MFTEVRRKFCRKYCKHFLLCKHSDTVEFSNQNIQIATLFLNIVQFKNLEMIEHKYLRYSFMEAYSIHSAIESQKTYMTVYCINDWKNIYKLDRSFRVRNKTKAPYDTTELKYYDFIIPKKVSSEIIINTNINQNGEKFNRMKIKCLKYEKSLPNIDQYKY